jgi:hypothetical protein
MYATRTCQLLAVQELGVRNRDVCIDLIDVSNSSQTETPKSKKRAVQRASISPGEGGSGVRKKFPCTVEGCVRLVIAGYTNLLVYFSIFVTLFQQVSYPMLLA